MAILACARNPHIYSVLRPRKPRTKSGCLACRARRKKCDEQKPVCRSCDRLQLACSWPASPSKESSVESSSSAPESQWIQPSHVSATTDMKDIPHTDSSFHPGGDEFDVLGSPKATLIAELRDLGHHLRERGILPYNVSIAPEVRDQILASNGPETAMLFDHFCHKTAPWLINGECYDNPVLRHIVPLTVTDDLVLRTVLAISGTHLLHSTPSIASVAMKYYSYALCSLKQRLSDWLSSSNKDYTPLFASMVLLCHCEFVQGNSYGAALQHMRACREFVEVALAHLHEPDHQDFVVFLVEHYGYFVLISNMRGPQEDNIGLGLEFSTTIMPLIKNFPSFGSIFAFEPEGFSLIPQIAQLAWRRKKWPSVPDDRLCRATYLTLLDSLRRNQYLPDESSIADSAEPGSWDKKHIVSSIKTNALLMFLHASFYEHDGASAGMTELLQPLINSTMTLIPHVGENNACYGLFWSILVTGSFIRDEDKQELLVRQLETNQSKMPFLKRGIDLLQWLWNDHDDMSFGLSGLERAATAYGVDLCIC